MTGSLSSPGVEIPLWSAPVPGRSRHRVRRACGNSTWTEWAPIDATAVRGEADLAFLSPIFRSYRGTIELVPTADGGTDVSWWVTFESKVPLAGGLWQRYLAWFMRRLRVRGNRVEPGG